MENGKPDFSGVWGTDFAPAAHNQPPEEPKLQPWAAAASKTTMDNLRRDSPEVTCLPMGPSVSEGVGKVVQTPGLLLMLHESAYYREIFLDGRDLPKDPNPDWMGYSVGRWEDDTLVIQSIGFNDRTWLRGDGIPHTEQLRVTERIHRSDFGHLEIRTTYSDPGALLAPWNVTTKYVFSDVQPLEYICNENERDRAHLIGRASDLQGPRVEPKVLAEYAGTYEYRPDGARELRSLVFAVGKDSRLAVSIGSNMYPLTAISSKVFVTSNGDRFEFSRADTGNVSYVKVNLFDGEGKAIRKE